MKKNAVSADTLLIAIRRKCMDCSGNSRNEVDTCRIAVCPLYPYRNVKATEDSTIDNMTRKGSKAS